MSTRRASWGYHSFGCGLPGRVPATGDARPGSQGRRGVGQAGRRHTALWKGAYDGGPDGDDTGEQGVAAGGRAGVHALRSPVRRVARVRDRRREMCIWEQPRTAPISVWVMFFAKRM